METYLTDPLVKRALQRAIGVIVCSQSHPALCEAWGRIDDSEKSSLKELWVDIVLSELEATERWLKNTCL